MSGKATVKHTYTPNRIANSSSSTTRRLLRRPKHRLKSNPRANPQCLQKSSPQAPPRPRSSRLTRSRPANQKIPTNQRRLLHPLRHHSPPRIRCRAQPIPRLWRIRRTKRQRRRLVRRRRSPPPRARQRHAWRIPMVGVRIRWHGEERGGRKPVLERAIRRRFRGDDEGRGYGGRERQ